VILEYSRYIRTIIIFALIKRHQMPLDPSVQLIISQSEVANIPNTYSIGCYAKRVTFHSQQNRALNLVWALFEKAKIASGSNVAIVGGGLAGMTVAVAAKEKGCKVTIFEIEDDFMPIQRGNNTRYIHPNIYDWPEEGSVVDETELPFLNWKAGNTDNVIQQIENEWDSCSSGIAVRKSTKVGRIFGVQNKPYIQINPGNEILEFDCIILAVGFGEEKTRENVAMTLYWTSDGLHQRPLGGNKKKFLVSGCGDGGLIDTLRLSIKNFEQKSFTRNFLTADFSKVFEELLRIDEKAPEDAEEASIYLYQEYSKLIIPPELEQFISDNLRTNTEVTLNGKMPTFMNTQSSILNRYAVFLIMRTNKISYQHGEISVARNSNRYQVIFKSTPVSTTVEYDDVVVRHGPSSVIGGLTGQDKAHYNSDKTDVTARRLWPDDFYTSSDLPTDITTTTTTQTPRSLRDTAMQYLDQLTAELIEQRSFTACYVGGTKDEPVYCIKVSTKTIPKKFKDFKEYKGTPITFTLEQKFKFSMSAGAINLKSIGSKNDILHSGTIIKNKNLVGGIQGTLGCFVITPSGMPAILTTSHVLSPKGENSGVVTALDFGGEREKIVADLSFGVRLYARKGTKELEKEVNLIDAAVAVLRSGINFSTQVPLPAGDNVSIQSVVYPDRGDIVIKYSDKNGLSTGRVVAENGTVKVEYAKVKRIFNDVIMIEGLNEEPFSRSGDSGALVYNVQGSAIGIIFAMSNSISIVCPLQSILRELNCTLFVS
jgi:hypothetical protein